MYNAFIAFIYIIILGAVIYAKIWWDGPGLSFKFTKWYFSIFFVVGLIVGVFTYAGVIQF